MVKHRCTHEEEIKQIILDKQDEKVEVTEIRTDLKYLISEQQELKKYLMGNGKPGKIRDIETTVLLNSNFRIAETARNKLIGAAVGGGWLLTIVMLILSTLQII